MKRRNQAKKDRVEELNVGARAVQMILENGTDGLLEAFRIVFKKTMLIKRSKAIEAHRKPRGVELLRINLSRPGFGII